GAVVCSPLYFTLSRSRDHRYLHSFPTRRSSDLHQGVLDLLDADSADDAGDQAGVGVESRGGEEVCEGRLVRQVARELGAVVAGRSEEHTSELQSRENLVCRLLLEKKKKKNIDKT